jgi:hypothetical protein
VARGRSAQHALHPLLHRHRLAVISVKIQVHSSSEGLRSDDQVHHAAQLRAFFVNSGGVKVVDLSVGLRPDGVRQWPGVLRKLNRQQRAHLLQPVVEAGRERRGELLVSGADVTLLG